MPHLPHPIFQRLHRDHKVAALWRRHITICGGCAIWGMCYLGIGSLRRSIDAVDLGPVSVGSAGGTVNIGPGVALSSPCPYIL
jgi:hypothetical protein